MNNDYPNLINKGFYYDDGLINSLVAKIQKRNKNDGVVKIK